MLFDVVLVFHFQFGSHHVSLFHRCLTGEATGVHGFIIGHHAAIDDFPQLIVPLSIDTGGARRETRSRRLKVPHFWVVEPVGQHIAVAVRHVVGKANHEVEVGVWIVGYLNGMGAAIGIFQGGVLLGRQHRASRVCRAVNGAIHGNGVNLFGKGSLLLCGELIVTPPVDGVACLEGLRYAVDGDGRCPDGVEVGLHVDQRNLAARGCRDGQRDVHRLEVGIG